MPLSKWSHRNRGVFTCILLIEKGEYVLFKRSWMIHQKPPFTQSKWMIPSKYRFQGTDFPFLKGLVFESQWLLWWKTYGSKILKKASPSRMIGGQLSPCDLSNSGNLKFSGSSPLRRCGVKEMHSQLPGTSCFFWKRWMGKQSEHLTNLKQGHCWGRSVQETFDLGWRFFGHHSWHHLSLGLLSPWNHYFWWRICLVDFVDKYFSHWLGFPTKIHFSHDKMYTVK